MEYKQFERNERLRKMIEEVIDQYGIKLKHVSNMTGLEYTTLSKWRRGRINYAKDNLNKLEHLIIKYKKQGV